MPVKTLLCCAIAATLAAPWVVHAAPFGAKAGAWEMTTTTVTTGMFIPPEMLAGMPPDQRARIEKHMQERSGKPTKQVKKTCITQQKLDQDAIVAMGDDGHCRSKTVSKSATKIKVERTCPAPRASTTTWIAEAPTPEVINATSDVTVQGGGKLHVDIKGKWLGASCEGIKQKG